jgi:CHASE2 domain-containing sensor protein
LIQFLSACILTFLLEQFTDHVINEDKNGDSVLAQSVLDVGGIYQQLVTTGPRKPISHYTVVVEIDPKKDPLSVDIYAGLCQQRAFLANLVGVVAAAHPAVIVLDKYFDTSRCTASDDAKLSDKLVRAWTTASQQIPVISGEYKSAIASTPPAGFYPPPGRSMFRLGILNLDRDTRRLPLRWILPPEDAALAARTDRASTLALQAAQQYDHHILSKNERMQLMVDRGENSYVSFLRPDQFVHFYAGEVQCMAPSPGMSAACAGVSRRLPRIGAPSLRDLSHEIVIIGERDERQDNYHTIVGVIPGFYLWANYIEAALDDRLFRPVHPLINYGIGFLIFAIFELILLQNHEKPLRAVWHIVLLFAGTVVTLYLVVVHFGYYINPATVGLVAICINLGHLKFAAAEHNERHRT